MEVQSICQSLRDVEIATGHVWAAVHDLRQNLSSLKADVEPDSTGEDGMGNAFCRRQEGLAACGSAVCGGWPIRSRFGGGVALFRAGNYDCAGDGAITYRGATGDL